MCINRLVYELCSKGVSVCVCLSLSVCVSVSLCSFVCLFGCECSRQKMDSEVEAIVRGLLGGVYIGCRWEGL